MSDRLDDLLGVAPQTATVFLYHPHRPSKGDGGIG